jgi:HEAT repeat protein
LEWALERATNPAKGPVARQPELDAEPTLEAPAPELLAAALREEDPLSREHVAHELRFRRDDESLSVLLRLLGDEDPAVRGVAAESLAARADRRGISPLIGALEIEDDDDARGRERAALAALAPDHDYFPD